MRHALVALAVLICAACSGSVGTAERIGDSLYECRGDGADAAIHVDGHQLHYDDAWNLYIRADAYSESPGIKSAQERSDWGKVADFIDACVVPSPRRLLSD